MTRGGQRQGAGRKPGPKYPGLKMRSMRMTDSEYARVKQLIKEWRKKENEKSE
jgi:hypothetical protein